MGLRLKYDLQSIEGGALYSHSNSIAEWLISLTVTFRCTQASRSKAPGASLLVMILMSAVLIHNLCVMTGNVHHLQDEVVNNYNY